MATCTFAAGTADTLDLSPFNLGEPLDLVEDCRGNFAIWRVNAEAR